MDESELVCVCVCSVGKFWAYCHSDPVTVSQTHVLTHASKQEVNHMTPHCDLNNAALIIDEKTLDEY